MWYNFCECIRNVFFFNLLTLYITWGKFVRSHIKSVKCSRHLYSGPQPPQLKLTTWKTYSCFFFLLLARLDKTSDNFLSLSIDWIIHPSFFPLTLTSFPALLKKKHPIAWCCHHSIGPKRCCIQPEFWFFQRKQHFTCRPKHRFPHLCCVPLPIMWLMAKRKWDFLQFYFTNDFLHATLTERGLHWNPNWLQWTFFNLTVKVAENKWVLSFSYF